MIIDVDSHLKETWILDEIYKLPPPYDEYTPVRVGDGTHYDAKFLVKWGGGRGRLESTGHDHDYMYNPRVNFGGGEMAARQAGGYDMEVRIKDVDLEGIDKQFIIGGTAGMGVEGGLGVVLCETYNDWAAAAVKEYEGRLYSVGVLPYANPGKAADELTRCVKDLGMMAFNLPQYLAETGLEDPALFPVYATAEELDVPLFCHGGGFANLLSSRFPQNLVGAHAVNRPAGASVALTSLVFGGIFEKFPRLRVIFFELSAEWIIYWIHRLEEDFEWYEGNQPRHLTVPLSKAPAEYVKQNIWITCEADEKRLPWAIEELGADHICMATDYPHFDSTFPNTVRTLRERNDLSAKDKDLILGGSAASLLRL